MRRLLHCSLMLVTMAAFTTRVPGATPPQPPQDEQRKAEPMNDSFGLALYAQLGAKPGNLFFSPTSVQAALAITAAGARGQTAEEMNRVLGLGEREAGGTALGKLLRQLNADGKKGGYELAVANALWAAQGYPFRPEYLATVENDYQGHLSTLNFAADPEAARKVINDWVSAQTRDRIRDLLPGGSIGPSTRLVLTNAIYFKGKWDLPFDGKQTRDGDFEGVDGRKVKTAFMHQQKNFNYAENDSVQVLELPYGQNDLAMRIYLPKRGDGPGILEKGLPSADLNALAKQPEPQPVQVSLPRFKLESSFELSDVLKAMGMPAACDPGRADFSGMTTGEHLFISAVVHKAFVNVDEEGTEAAAATGIVMRPTAVYRPVQPKVFNADHPFLFSIVHQKTGALLFMGRLATP